MSDFSDFINSINPFSSSDQPPVAQQPQVSGPMSLPDPTGSNPQSAPGYYGAQAPSGNAGSNASPSLLNQAWKFISGDKGLSGLTQNLSPLIAGGGLLNAVLKGPGKIPQKSNLQAQASQLSQNAAPLLAAENTGVLPNGEEAGVDQQLQATLNGIKEKYAQMGLSGSTMEQQDIANAQQSAVAQRAALAQQATQEGLQMSGRASQDYGALATLQLQQQKDLQDQIAEMLKAFGGGQGKTQ